MRSKLLSTIVGLTILAGISGATVAGLIGILPAFPSLVFDNQGSLTYIAAANLAIDASPIAIRFSPTSVPRFVHPTGDPPTQVMNIRVNVDTMGQLAGGVAGDDLVIMGEVDEDGDGLVDFAGLLLTGEVSEFGFEDIIGATADLYDLRFTCTGGSLATLFGDQDIGVRVTSEASSFDGVFTADFAGGAKGIVVPIEPTCVAPVVTASLEPIAGGDGEGTSLGVDADGKKHKDDDEGLFVVVFGFSNQATACEPTTCVGELVCGRTRIAVVSGEIVEIENDDEGCEVEIEHGSLEMEGPDIFLEVTCTNSAGSVTVQAFPTGLMPDNDTEDEDDD